MEKNVILHSYLAAAIKLRRFYLDVEPNLKFKVEVDDPFASMPSILKKIFHHGEIL